MAGDKTEKQSNPKMTGTENRGTSRPGFTGTLHEDYPDALKANKPKPASPFHPQGYNTVKEFVPEDQRNARGTTYRDATDANLIKGGEAEQRKGFNFYRRENGWIAIDGPSGAAGHLPNAPGEDGAYYNKRTGEIHLVDNKALASEDESARPIPKGEKNRVRSATAIDPDKNLLDRFKNGRFKKGNLTKLIDKVDTDPNLNDLPGRIRIKQQLTRVRRALSQGKAMPDGVKLVVTNVGGKSVGLSKNLRDKGIRFFDDTKEPQSDDDPRTKRLAPHRRQRFEVPTKQESKAPGKVRQRGPNAPKMGVGRARGYAILPVLMGSAIAAAVAHLEISKRIERSLDEMEKRKNAEGKVTGEGLLEVAKKSEDVEIFKLLSADLPKVRQQLFHAREEVTEQNLVLSLERLQYQEPSLEELERLWTRRDELEQLRNELGDFRAKLGEGFDYEAEARDSASNATIFGTDFTTVGLVEYQGLSLQDALTVKHFFLNYANRVDKTFTTMTEIDGFIEDFDSELERSIQVLEDDMLDFKAQRPAEYKQYETEKAYKDAQDWFAGQEQ